MVETFYKTIHRFSPQFLNWLRAVKDPRVKKKIKYPVQNLAYVGILLFLLKLGSRRQVKYLFSTPEFVKNLNILSETEMERVADPGTLENLLKQVNPEDIGKVRTKIVNNLIRKKVLAKFRLFGQYYTIAIDGTGHLVFKERHRRHCLTKKKKGKVLYYYHPAMPASRYLIWARNMAGNTLLPLNEGSMKEVFREYLCLKNSLCKEDTVHYKDGNIAQDYNWVTDIDYEGHKLNVLELDETKPGKKKKLTTTKFVWLTNFVPDKRNHVSLAEGGRMRWKMENEGYNTQKNGGYNLEHAYSRDETAMKNYYFLLQIAHIINQLMEKGSLIAEQIKKVFGSIRNVARQLLEDLRIRLLDKKGELTTILSQSFQIRLDSS